MNKGNIEKRSRIGSRILGIIAVALLVLSMVSGCRSDKEEEVSKDIKVDTRTVESGTLEITTDYMASLSPNIAVDVIPLVSGTVKEVHAKVGDRVKAGDLLCQLDDKAADFTVQTAEDAVNTAKAGKKAAESQTDSAKIQADTSVKTLNKTIKNYKDSLKTAQKQLKKLKKSRAGLKKSQDASREAYAVARTRYKTAQALQIQFESFLNKYPDCKTTAGLTLAATGVSSNPADYTIDPGDGSNDSGTSPGSSEGDDKGDGAGGQPGSGGSGSQTDSGNGGSSSENTAVSAAKQKQAQSLLTALNEVGLTVEYLSAAGLNSLKENMADGETAYTGAVNGATQLDTAIETLKANISQLKAQISATQDSLESAKKLSALSSAGTEVYDAQIAAAQTGVDAAKYQKDLYRITAPIDGVVDEVNVKEDGMTAQGYAAFTISEKESMIATFYVTEEVKNFLKIGDPVVLADGTEDDSKSGTGGNPGDMIVGSITMLGTSADAAKGLFKVEAEIFTVGQRHLSGGTSVKLSVVSNAVRGQLLIPYDSVYYEDGQAYVYTVIDGLAHRTDISTGLFNQDLIAVTDGLTQGDTVVTTWASGLKDGAKVSVVSNDEQ